MQHVVSNERGMGHIGLILGVVVLAVVGFAGWWVYSKNHSPTNAADTALREAIKNAKCDYDDKDLCKFFTSFKAQKYYSVTATTKGGDQNGQTSKIETEGDNSHVTITGGSVPYEVITLGKTIYTKGGDGTWWKQTVTSNDSSSTTTETKAPTFTEPTKEADSSAPTYVKIGKEACGKLTCFKYQETTPGSKSTTYLWFDDEDYQMRRFQSTDEAGVAYDATYSYDKVSVTAPSPTKELGPNQYIVPGQNEPVTLPAAGDGTMPSDEELQQLIQQYQQ